MIIEKYKIYSDGRVENTKTGKFLKHQGNGFGYLKVTLTISGKPIQRYVHRLVAEAYCIKTDYTKNQVNHKDGNKSNNSYLNLEWVTNSENQIHAHENGLKRNGNQLWNGKFSEDDIRKIFELKSSGEKQYNIAKIMNTMPSTISDILNGKRYKHITQAKN